MWPGALALEELWNALQSQVPFALLLIVKGGTNQQIADELVVSRDTVRNHVASILSKLDAHSKLQAAAIAAQRGLLSEPRA